FARHAGHHVVDQGERLVFAKRNEMNFVINKYALALRIKNKRAVVRQKSAVGCSVLRVHRWFPFDGPRKEGMSEADGERGGNLCELRILKRKRRRRFGPD